MNYRHGIQDEDSYGSDVNMETDEQATDDEDVSGGLDVRPDTGGAQEEEEDGDEWYGFGGADDDEDANAGQDEREGGEGEEEDVGVSDVGQHGEEESHEIERVASIAPQSSVSGWFLGHDSVITAEHSYLRIQVYSSPPPETSPRGGRSTFRGSEEAD